MTKKTSAHQAVLSRAEGDQRGLTAKVGEALSFWGVILLSAAAVAAIAIATPLVLAIAAITGLAAGKEQRRSTWRPTRA